MALTINKNKSATKTTKTKTKVVATSVEDQQSEQIVDAALVDEFLALTKAIEKHNDKIKGSIARAAELKAAMVGAADEFLPADDELVLLDSTGNTKVTISAKANATSITDMAGAKKALGTETFMEIAKVGITDLKSYLPKDKFEAVTTTEQTGPRKVKIS